MMVLVWNFMSYVVKDREKKRIWNSKSAFFFIKITEKGWCQIFYEFRLWNERHFKTIFCKPRRILRNLMIPYTVVMSMSLCVIHYRNSDNFIWHIIFACVCTHAAFFWSGLYLDTRISIHNKKNSWTFF